MSTRYCLKTNTRFILQISDLITGATRDLRLEVATLEKKLHESHVRCAEESESKEKEIEKLKNLVAELESRLKKEIDNSDLASADLRKEMKQKSDELERVLLEQTQLTQQFQQSQQEVGQTMAPLQLERASVPSKTNQTNK